MSDGLGLEVRDPEPPAIESLVTTFGHDPADFYERLRAAGDVVWDEGMNAWLVTRYDLIRRIALEEHEVFQSPRIFDADHPMLGLTETEIYRLQMSEKMIMNKGGAEHDRIHRWYTRVLSPRVLNSWDRALIEPIVNAQIDRFIKSGRAELVSEFAERVTARVLSAVQGLTWDDETLDHLTKVQSLRTSVLSYQIGPPPPRELIERAMAAADESVEMVMPYVRERKGGKGDDFISIIWRDGSELFGDSFDEVDVAAAAVQAFNAGSGTTAATAANGLYMLLRDPSLRDRLRSAVVADDDQALKVFIEETLRLYSSFEFTGRRVLIDTEIAGVTIKKGELVIALMACANRDPAHYGCPMDVDLGRRPPRDHLGFYMGPRTCAGQSLARYQLERIHKVALHRLPEDLRLDPDREPPEYSGSVLRSWRPLHVVFTPGFVA